MEVLPETTGDWLGEERILHVCGGIAQYRLILLNLSKYSPRMWRYCHEAKLQWAVEEVFSTYVEVLLSFLDLSLCAIRILHVCGGIAHSNGTTSISKTYSPRMWRYCWWDSTDRPLIGVFSTYVEVLL